MAYQMQYNFQTVKVEKIKHITKYRYLWVVLGLILGAIFLHFSGSVIEMVLLGERETVQTALTQMVDRLHSGVVLEDAVAAFCDEIIE